MLLIEMDINGHSRRLSTSWLPLEHIWDGLVASFSSVQISTQKSYGGLAAPVFGRIDVLPEAFDDNWIPPVSCGITAKIAISSEEDASYFFGGTAHRERIKRDGNEYQLYPSDFAIHVIDAEYSGTLVDVFSSACVTLGLTLDTSSARNPSPDVDWQATGDRILIGNLSTMSSFFTHMFYIKEGTLFLVDMLQDNGSRTLTEFDIFPSVYNDPPPMSAVSCTLAGNEYSVVGPYSYGDPFLVDTCCHTVQTNIEEALTNIKDVVTRPSVQLIKPLSEPPMFGERVSLTDRSLHHPINVWARIRKITWDFDSEQCILEGEGGLS